MDLAESGFTVDLYDRLDQPLAATASHNEGKVHLGYVYANDRSRRTARLMARGAFWFEPLLRRWLGSAIDTVSVSPGFDYGIHRDSLIDADGVARHFEACHEFARQEATEHGASYFGERSLAPPRRLRSYDDLLSPAHVTAAWRTAELGIDTVTLAEAFRRRLRTAPHVRLVLTAEVAAVTLADDRATVTFERDGERFEEGYDHVVNALWSGRLIIDAQAGLHPHRPWLFRRRDYLRGRVDPGHAARIPCVTLIVGPFGDVVRFGNGYFHLSWYPVGMTTASRALQPAWPTQLGAGQAARVRDGTIAALCAIIPALESVLPTTATTLESGTVFAWGASDISDQRSALHSRSDVGVTSRGRYHSIDSGKLTTAPLFAAALARRIRGH
jgi:hypothetical protein